LFFFFDEKHVKEHELLRYCGKMSFKMFWYKFFLLFFKYNYTEEEEESIPRRYGFPFTQGTGR